MRLIIAGGRDYDLTAHDFACLDAIHTDSDTGISVVLSGGAKGADRGGEIWAKISKIKVETFLPNWRLHGLSAGPRRNAEMAAKADAVALFPGGRGTESMYNEAKKKGLKIFDYREDS